MWHGYMVTTFERGSFFPFFFLTLGRKFEARGSLALAGSEVFAPKGTFAFCLYGTLFHWQLGGWVVGKALSKSRRKWFKGGISDVTAVEERRGERRGEGGEGGWGVGHCEGYSWAKHEQSSSMKSP